MEHIFSDIFSIFEVYTWDYFVDVLQFKSSVYLAWICHIEHTIFFGVIIIHIFSDNFIEPDVT